MSAAPDAPAPLSDRVGRRYRPARHRLAAIATVHGPPRTTKLRRAVARSGTCRAAVENARESAHPDRVAGRCMRGGHQHPCGRRVPAQRELLRARDRRLPGTRVRPHDARRADRGARRGRRALPRVVPTDRLTRGSGRRAQHDPAQHRSGDEDHEAADRHQRGGGRQARVGQHLPLLRRRRPHRRSRGSTSPVTRSCPTIPSPGAHGHSNLRCRWPWCGLQNLNARYGVVVVTQRDAIARLAVRGGAAGTAATSSSWSSSRSSWSWSTRPVVVVVGSVVLVVVVEPSVVVVVGSVVDVVVVVEPPSSWSSARSRVVVVVEPPVVVVVGSVVDVVVVVEPPVVVVGRLRRRRRRGRATGRGARRRRRRRRAGGRAAGRAEADRDVDVRIAEVVVVVLDQRRGRTGASRRT